MRIYKLYEFLNMNNYYSYEKIKEVDVEETDSEYSHFDSIYEFKSKSGKIYSMSICYYHHDCSITFDWAEKSDFEKMRRGEIHKYITKTKWNELNINDIERILTTIFKILLDYLNKYEISFVSAGSFAKYKYKAYKSIIKSMPEFEIIKDIVVPKDKSGGWPPEIFFKLIFKKIK